MCRGGLLGARSAGSRLVLTQTEDRLLRAFKFAG